MTTPRSDAPNTDTQAAVESTDDRSAPETTAESARPADRAGLAERIRGMPERRWSAVQIVGGVLLGCVCGALLMVLGAIESVGMYGTFAALVLALVAPQMIEKRVGRSVRRGQTAMLGTLAAWVLGYGAPLLCAGTPFVN